MSIIPVILCGGNGTRLWPLSREALPKQFMSLDGDRTLFRDTIARIAGLTEAEAPLVVSNAAQRFLVAEQLRQSGREARIILEPDRRNTAPAVAAAALVAQGGAGESEDDPLLLVLPADHSLAAVDAFLDAVRTGAELASEGFLVTFGVQPLAAETGFGYIRRGDPAGGGYLVSRFVEKPDAQTAREFIQSGDYFWNSGIFLFRASVYLDALNRYAPAIYEAAAEAVEGGYSDLDFIRLGEKAFRSCPADSVDYAVLEKSPDVRVVALDSPWSDLGSWPALFEAGQPDERGNVSVGDVVERGARGCYLHAQDRLLAVVGMEDAVVVETADAVLVARQDRAQEVREVVETLRAQGREEVVFHRRVLRPWGSFEGLVRSERFQVKRITVNPGHILSLQKHHHRAEHWVVVRGTAKVTVDGEVSILTEDQSTYVPLGSVHRLENPGRIPLEIIEVQTGSYLGEDDIVRLEDAYSRDRQ